MTHIRLRPAPPRALAWGMLALILVGACATVDEIRPSPSAASAASTQPASAATPAGEGPAAAASAPGSVTLSPCHLSVPGLSVRLAAECGTLTVYEDRSAGRGRTIDLNLAVLKARSRNPAPDPLFFLAGGPGQAATESYPQMAGAFSRVNMERDIVLVDQRGTGRSNPLACPPVEGGDVLGGDRDEIASFAADCLQQLIGDPRLYTTAIAMDDLDQVRAALGYDQINLYGISYGTRAALTYLQRHPERVRSMILDGVVPQDEALGLEVARDAQRAIDLLFARCAAEAACQARFPDVKSEFDAVAAGLSAQPAQVELRHPVTGETTEMKLTYDAFASSVRLLSYTPETASLLPLLIHQAHTMGDFSLLTAQAVLVAESLGESITSGMGYSVLCAEDVPFVTQAQAAQANAGTYLGDTQTEALLAICEVWPAGDLPPGFKQSVRSEAPVLLLSGEADPVTPPENAVQAARTLPNSLHLIAPGQGHGVVGRGCLPQVAAEFVAEGSAASLNTACVQEIEPMPFFVNFAGPAP